MCKSDPVSTARDTPENPPDSADTEPSHAVFFARFTEYKGLEQVEDSTHPDCDIICRERPDDREKLEKLVQPVKQTGGNVDIDKFEFTWLKELHPLSE
jgi:hypothetical protein